MQNLAFLMLGYANPFNLGETFFFGSEVVDCLIVLSVNGSMSEKLWDTLQSGETQI